MANTIIKDPALIPFYISKDQYCFTVIEVITPDEKNIGIFKKKDNGNEGKDYEKPLRHHSNLSSALQKIPKSKVDHKKDYSSIMSYIEEYKKETNAMEQLLNKIGI